MASILKCKICGDEYKKKDVFLSDGKIMDEETCICTKCISCLPIENKTGKVNIFIIIILFLILVFLAFASFFAYKNYNDQKKQKKLEDEVTFQLFNKHADFSIELKNIENKYALEDALIDKQMKACKSNDADDIETSKKKLEQERKLIMMKLEVKRNKVKDLRKALERMCASYVSEVGKLHPDKAKEIEEKVKLLLNQNSLDKSLLFKKLFDFNFDEIEEGIKNGQDNPKKSD